MFKNLEILIKWLGKNDTLHINELNCIDSTLCHHIVSAQCSFEIPEARADEVAWPAMFIFVIDVTKEHSVLEKQASATPGARLALE